ncbi:phosphoglycerate mutase [Brevibacterium ravenspurgense]|uniref:Phosphoglycerate mutase n=1 Tax=Brevibacterium ravenspurgense TaxID=479117 RepID=A0A2I1IJW4_9MICO|nr:histidine phosphatase family protein [Brevibacterium ravenspurgense]MCG7299839.1 histidine phosphatase family protein [Brevibacterium ravenspurgense]PKY71382.1 phosphoglycerate mutase [Brevibacterium ravenspurgense]
MVKIIFARHGQSEANLAGVLAGRRGANPLTAAGRQQACAAADLLPSSIALWKVSEIARCAETADLLMRTHAKNHDSAVPAAAVMGEFSEVDYGDWSGRPLEELRRLPEWERVQNTPQDMVFPGGEAQHDAWLRTRQGVEKVLDELRERNSEAVAVVVTHGDIIKMAVADALGLQLQNFQRTAVAPGSLTTIDYASRVPVLTALSVTPAGRTGQAGTLGGGA